MERQIERRKNPKRSVEDCTELIIALERLYKTIQVVAFYFVPRDVMKEVIEASEHAERVLKEFKQK
jgi:hypothetical protein